jgi:hypothetical protein
MPTDLNVPSRQPVDVFRPPHTPLKRSVVDPFWRAPQA